MRGRVYMGFWLAVLLANVVAASWPGTFSSVHALGAASCAFVIGRRSR